MITRLSLCLSAFPALANAAPQDPAKTAAESVEGVESARVDLVWKPFWTPDRIDPKVRAALGY